MAEVIATVESLEGTFYVKESDGSLREIKVGDKIYEGEVVVGSQNNNLQDKLILVMQDGSEMILLGDDKQLFDASLNNQEFATNETVINEDSITSIVDEIVNTPTPQTNIENTDTAAGEKPESSSETSEVSFGSDFNKINLDAQQLEVDVKEIGTEKTKAKEIIDELLAVEGETSQDEVLDETTQNVITTLAENVATLTAAATDAADAASAAADAATTAAQTAAANPTPENLTAAEDAQQQHKRQA